MVDVASTAVYSYPCVTVLPLGICSHSSSVTSRRDRFTSFDLVCRRVSRLRLPAGRTVIVARHCIRIEITPILVWMNRLWLHVVVNHEVFLSQGKTRSAALT